MLDDERAELLELVECAANHIEALRKCNKVLHAHGDVEGDKFIAVFQQLHITCELDSIISSMQMKILRVTVH